MTMVTRFSIVLAIAFCAIGCLAEHQPPDDDISARILVPLSGNKTTFRFVIRNNTSKVVGVNHPFVDGTRLLVVYPDGKKGDLGGWKEGLRPDPLSPGKQKHWDVDLRDWIQFKQNGEYTISFSANKHESNGIVLVKE